jgi:hypothetical protein
MNYYEEIKTQRRSVRSQMPRLQRHRIFEGQTAGQAGVQNLSSAVREMRRQGADRIAACLRAKAFNQKAANTESGTCVTPLGYRPTIAGFVTHTASLEFNMARRFTRRDFYCGHPFTVRQ